MSLDDELRRMAEAEAAEVRSAERAARDDARLKAETAELTRRFLELAQQKKVPLRTVYWKGQYREERNWMGRRTGHRRFERAQGVRGWFLYLGHHDYWGSGSQGFLALTEDGHYVTGSNSVDVGTEPAFDACQHYGADGECIGGGEAASSFQLHHPSRGSGRCLDPEKIRVAMAHLLSKGTALERPGL